MKMIKLEYTVKFVTPAFLGNAEQNAQWRTPPFKALLRQWWRVAVAQELKYNVDAIRKKEGLLFGVAADGGDSHKSQIRIRLDHWHDGKLKSWDGLGRNGTITHPEVRNAQGNATPVGSDLYLGYGPLRFANGSTALKANAAIQAGETAIISLAVPEDIAPTIQHALWLVDQFGTIGGRSRNGWGSFSLTSINETPPFTGTLPLRDWQQCLALDWPHALGKNGQGVMAWQTKPVTDWKVLMRDLAKIKIDLRTQFKFSSGRDAPQPEQRHWLSYPVTNHSVRPWGNNARLPNSLRFKVRPTADGNLVGVIFHVPCLPPQAFRPDTQAITQVWQQVHTFLSQQNNLQRIQG